MSDGHVIMERRSYAEAVAKFIYNEVRFQINQGPSYIGLHIDPSKFFESLSFETPSGERETIRDWEFAPESRHSGARGLEKRSLHVKAEERWRVHVKKTARIVPYWFGKGLGSKAPPRDRDGDAVMSEGGGSNTGRFC
jgi:hypothetical protein